MIKISKIDAFILVAQADEKGDTETANKILNIIFRALQKEKETNMSLNYIEVSKKESIYFKDIINKQEQEN